MRGDLISQYLTGGAELIRLIQSNSYLSMPPWREQRRSRRIGADGIRRGASRLSRPLRWRASHPVWCWRIQRGKWAASDRRFGHFIQ